jgi:uncharacterized protein (TIGR00725 family)
VAVVKANPGVEGRPGRVYVGVVGAGDAAEDELATAEEIGAKLAQRGATLVCGGLGGVMEAACRGAKSAGGVTVGILPRLSRADANRYVDVAIPTGMGELRNGLVVRASDVLIAVAGEYGTLSEIAFALKTGVPVVGVSTWDLARRGSSDAIVAVTSAEEAVNRALSLAVHG